MQATLTLHCRIVPTVSVASNSRWNGFEWSYIGGEWPFSGEAIAGEQSNAIGESGNRFAAQYLTVRTSALRYGTSVQ